MGRAQGIRWKDQTVAAAASCREAWAYPAAKSGAPLAVAPKGGALGATVKRAPRKRQTLRHPTRTQGQGQGAGERSGVVRWLTAFSTTCQSPLLCRMHHPPWDRARDIVGWGGATTGGGRAGSAPPDAATTPKARNSGLHAWLSEETGPRGPKGRRGSWVFTLLRTPGSGRTPNPLPGTRAMPHPAPLHHPLAGSPLVSHNATGGGKDGGMRCAAQQGGRWGHAEIQGPCSRTIPHHLCLQVLSGVPFHLIYRLPK